MAKEVQKYSLSNQVVLGMFFTPTDQGSLNLAAVMGCDSWQYNYLLLICIKELILALLYKTENFCSAYCT